MGTPTTPPPTAGADTFGGAESPLLGELRTLILSRSALVTIETDDEGRAESLLAAAARGVGVTHVEWTITKGVTFIGGRDFVPDSTDPVKALKAVDAFAGNGLFVLKGFSKHLDDPALSRYLMDLTERFTKPPCLSTIVILDAEVVLPAEVAPLAAPLEISLPEPHEYEQAVREVIQSLLTGNRARVEVGAEAVPKLAQALRGLTLNQARRAVAQVAVEDGRLDAADLARLVDIKAGLLEHGGPLEYFPANSIEAELGGFTGLRAWLARQRLAFSPEARQLNLPEPKGVMLVGVQGCGKSLAAKVIARDWGLPLVRLDVGSLYEKFIGESEKNFRQAIEVAESLAPVVLWIDEIEKAISPSGGEADAGLGTRIFGAFLTWLQEKSASVFVVATANDIAALPPELLRKGRFDEIFFVDLPDAAERAEIFRIHLAFRRQDPATFDLVALAAATEGFSGAEIEHVVITALLEGLQEKQRPDTAAIARVAEATIPLSRSRAEEIQQLRETARGRFAAVR